MPKKKVKSKKPASLTLANWWPGCGRPKPNNTMTVKPAGKIAVTIDLKLEPRKPLKRRKLANDPLDEQYKPLKVFTMRRTKRTMQSLRGSKWDCNYHVKTIAGLTAEQAIRMISVRPHSERRDAGHDDTWYDKKPETFATKINYPLSVSVNLTIPPCKIGIGGKRARTRTEMHPGFFLWIVAQQYKKIYEEAERSVAGKRKYGVWGHELDDLWFEGLCFDKKGNVHLWIGS